MCSGCTEGAIILAARCETLTVEERVNIIYVFERMNDQDRLRMMRRRYEGGQTILHVVSKNPYLVDLVKRLLQYGMDPNCVTSTGVTPLIIACNSVALSNMEMLLAYGADPNVIVGDMFSPLSISIMKRSSESVRILLDANATVNKYAIGFLLLTAAHDIEKPDMMKWNSNVYGMLWYSHVHRSSLVCMCRHALRQLELRK
jgi:hypothetical protein